MAVLRLEFQAGRPLLEILLSASGPYLRKLNEQARPAPDPLTAVGIIDTGAGTTCVDQALVSALKLSPEGDTQIYTPSTGSKTVARDVYFVGLVLLSGAAERLVLPNVRVVATDLSAQGIQVLLGRDLLARCLLVYDGKHQSLTLAY